MPVPTDRRYLASHEWHRLEGQTVTIGITQFAADELTDITFVDLPKVGARVEAGKPFGVIESVKATADLYCGVSGTVTAVNDKLSADPGLVNKDPYAGGWMVQVQAADVAQLERLMSAQEYEAKVGG